MRVLVLKPHELANPGLIGEALLARGAELIEHVLADDGPPPPLEGFDAVVVMGAPWSVYGDEVRPWIDGLLERLRQAVADRRAGAGSVLRRPGVRRSQRGWVARSNNTEVGLHQVDTSDPDAVPAGPWFMWHGDTFGPPEGATVLARSAEGPQAYSLGPHLLVQFHPEATADIVSRWLDYDDADFRAAGVDAEATLDAMRASEIEARHAGGHTRRRVPGRGRSRLADERTDGRAATPAARTAARARSCRSQVCRRRCRSLPS